MIRPLALILADEFESRDLLWPLIRECQQSFNIKVLAPQFLKKFHQEYSDPQPIIFFANPNLRYPNPQEIFNFHQKSPNFPLCFSTTGEIVSFNPKQIEVLDDGRLSPKNQLNCFTNVKVQRILPPIDPVTIIVRIHRRKIYLELTLRSLLFSLGARANQVYILLALSDPTPEIEMIAQDFLQKHPKSDAIKITPNSYLGTGKAALLWAQYNQKELKKVVLFEDDFILPAVAKDLYPD